MPNEDGSHGHGSSGGSVTDDEARQEIFQAVSLAYHISSRNVVPGGVQDDNDAFRTLEEFCNPKMMSEPRKPLAVVGKRGCGKSALLASWVGHRKTNNPNKKDLIIYHFAGCNTPSMQVRNFLYRCCLRMRDFFRLKSEVTFDEEHLTWDFPRMLEFCAAKGRIIIVVDGLNLLRLVEHRDNLRWLPTVFPPNVRVIVSFTEATVPRSMDQHADETFLTHGAGMDMDVNEDGENNNDGEDGSDGDGGEAGVSGMGEDGSDSEEKRRSKTPEVNSAELAMKKAMTDSDMRLNRLRHELITRRGLAVVKVEELDSAGRILLCKAFCEQKEMVVDPNTEETKNSDSDTEKGEPGEDGEPQVKIKEFGFYLFEKTFVQLVEHPLLSQSTQCLVSVCKTLRLAAKWDLDLFGVVDKLLQATTEFELSHALVDLWEKGLPKGSSEPQTEAGGLSALRRQGTITGQVRKLQLVEHDDELLDVEATMSTDPASQSYTEVVYDDVEIDLPRASEDLDEIPSFLDGGTKFAGFGPAFQCALGLLCSAHYGLRAGELWAMLEIAGQEVKDYPADNRRRFLQALEPLGLRVIMGKLLVVPPSLTVLPMVVAALHGDDHLTKTRRRMSAHICMFFKNQPRSYRRMEELPFALEFCGKWRELKTEITNMHTFRLMCESGCFWCASLTRFWRMLASGIRSKNDDWNLGNPSGRHYDPVDEFARALQVFVRDENPPVADVTYLADLILHFFEDFSRFESRVPNFLHPQLDHDSLVPINLGNKDIKGKAPYYFYKRWLWVVFPWLALGTMDAHVRSTSSPSFAGSGHNSGRGSALDSGTSITNDDTLSHAKDGGNGDDNNNGKSSNNNNGDDGDGTEYVSVMKKSFWATKKVKPTRGIGSVNSARLNSRIRATNARLGRSATSAVEKTLKPNGSERKNNAVSRADRMVNYGADIPFSAPSMRAKKNGSRFPSVEANLRDKGQRLTPIFSGGMIPADRRSLPSTTTDTTIHFQNLPAHLTSYPVTVTDAKRAESAGMLLKLREKYDKLMYESNKLQKQLGDLRSQVSEREKQDAFTEKLIQSGEQYMQELESRMVKVNNAVDRAKRTTAFYQKILIVCEKNPFKDKTIVNSRDRLAQDCKEELHSAMKRLSKAEDELRQLVMKERPRLERELEKSRKLQSTVLRRLDDVHANLQKDREETKELANRRSAILAEVAGDLNFKEERRLKAMTTQQSLYNKHLSKTANNFKQQLSKYQSAFEKIVKATGLTDPDAIFSKYMNKDIEEAQLMKQHQEYRAKLAVLQQQKEALQKDVESETAGTQVVTSRQIRHIDDLNFEAENQLKRNHEKYAQSRALLKDVKSGILHLAHMMDIGRHSSIEQLDLLPVLRMMHNKLTELKKSKYNRQQQHKSPSETADKKMLAKISKEMMVPNIVGKFDEDHLAHLGQRLGDVVVDVNFLDSNMARDKHDAISDVDGEDQSPGIVLTRSLIKEASKASEKRREKDRRKKDRSPLGAQRHSPHRKNSTGSNHGRHKKV